MTREGFIYVVAFDSGTVKVGQAADAATRLAAHRRDAARHGIKVAAEWSSSSHDAFLANERKLIDFCRQKGTPQAGSSEYFIGLEFTEVRDFAAQLSQHNSQTSFIPAHSAEAGTSALSYGGVYESPEGVFLLVASEGILAHPGRRWLLALEVRSHDDGDLLTVAIDVPGVGHRYVNTGNISRILRDSIGEQSGTCLGILSADDMESIQDMFAVVLDL
ncbi:hypothetical protein HS048_36005 [Planomonospora sp. ID91781]|uniref:hypothetical protein n=1 Tax=Planomonospora sp. ID91781 TaxID=2738135 RepID=UPI0018C3DC90|nr:hypothetical protein [Planomonospora sp. ID91781]MBG0826074.1 hypothetical protein [Planomonospora sp. ID91781]